MSELPLLWFPLGIIAAAGVEKVPWSTDQIIRLWEITTQQPNSPGEPVHSPAYHHEFVLDPVQCFVSKGKGFLRPPSLFGGISLLK